MYGTFFGANVAARRRLLIVLSVTLLIPKLIIAARTYGTNDIAHWQAFARLIRTSGPIGIYKYPFSVSYYNHPPLMGYVLEAEIFATHHGIPLRFSVRALSSLADVATTVLVFELLRRRTSLARASFGATVVAMSPVLFIISGFHGNTDPLFTMLTLLSVYLLADRELPLLAGCAMALSLGVKIVPVVVVPCLLVYALMCGRRTLALYLSGLICLSCLYWVPALVGQFTAVRHNVLGYAGLNDHNWGVGQLERDIGNQSLTSAIDGSGRLVLVAICAIGPALLVWRRPEYVMQGAAFALAGFLALTPTFGTQYIVWAAAPIMLISTWAGAAFNALAGILLVEVYTHWSGGFPWNRAHASTFTSAERSFGLVVWIVLLIALLDGAHRLSRRHQPTASRSEGRSLQKELRA